MKKRTDGLFFKLPINKYLHNSQTFRAVANDWLDSYLKRVSYINYKKSTKAAFERAVERFGDTEVQKITLQEVDSFLSELINKGYYKKTIATQKSVLNQVMRLAVYKGYIQFNPIRDLKLPSNLPEGQRVLPDTDELKIVSSHYEGFDFLPYFLLYTGMRISEALALSDKDFDMKNKLITVNKHIVWENNKPIILPRTKTKAGERKVAILNRLYDKLPDFEGLLFCNSDGSALTNGQLRKRWEKYQKTYNLTVTAHQLRHAFATMCFEAELDVKDTQMLMGHSDIELTKRIYTHIREERMSKSIEKLNNFEFWQRMHKHTILFIQFSYIFTNLCNNY